MAEVRGASQLNIQIEGLEELQAQFNKLGKMPKKHLTRAGRAGIAKDLQDAKAKAPTGDTGNLKKSIKKKMETPNKRNKGVYRLQFDSKMTPDFRRKTTGVYGGWTPYAYYPSSVEYGYKGKKGHVKVKTMYWADKVLRQNEASSIKKVIDSLNNSIDELTK
jgi:hypothetical protein